MSKDNQTPPNKTPTINPTTPPVIAHHLRFFLSRSFDFLRLCFSLLSVGKINLKYMKLLEIMKNWGVNDTPNDIRHFEQEVREHYQNDLKEALKLALGCLEQEEYWCKKPEHTIKKIKDAIKQNT